MNQEKSVLVLALSGLGDALMFTPAIQALRKQFPDAQIDALVMFSAVEELYNKTKLLNNVIFFDFMKEGAVRSLKKVLELRGRYTHSISVYPSNRVEYNGIQFLIGAKKRGQIAYKRKDWNNFGFLNTIRIAEDDTVHNAEHNLRLCSTMFGVSLAEDYGLLFPLGEAEQCAAHEYAVRTAQGKMIIGMHPGCNTLKNHINRRWEPEKFAALALECINKYDAEVWLFGGPEEKELRDTILTLAGSLRCYEPPSQSLTQTAALMKECTVFVSNDSGLMHIAASQKVPVAAIIGPTNKRYIYPWKTEHIIISSELDCAPCFFYSPQPLQCSRNDVQYKCIKELSVSFAATQLETFLKQIRSRTFNEG